MKDANPEGLQLRWRWQTPGEVLLEEWLRDPDKPSYVMTIRLGEAAGTLHLKSSAMMGKEWVGTVHDDGSISFVGKGILKMPYTVRIDEQGAYEQADTRGHIYKYVAVAEPAASVAVAQTAPSPEVAPAPSSSPAPAPVAANTPSSKAPSTVVPTAPVPVPSPTPAPVVARQQPSPPAPPVKVPRKLTDAELARIARSVQESRARSAEQARQIELQRQEAARQAQIQAQIWAAAEAQRQAEEAAADAEFEAERARKAAAWQQMTQANEQALADSMARLQATTASIQAQQAEAAARQRAQAEAADRAERQRQVELIRQANQRQEEEAARLAAQRQQYEQQRAAAQAAELERAQQRSAGAVAGAGRASTETDANRCVSSAELRENDTFQGNTAAYVVNGCGTPVDVKICLMTDSGWKCGATWGLAAQSSWSHSAFRATGRVFVDAKTAGSSRALASPN